MADQDSTRNDWTSIEEVQEQISRAADMVARQRMRHFVEFMYGALRIKSWYPIESPLEAIFCVWWNAHIDGLPEQSAGAHLHLSCQREVVAAGQNYRLDFVVGLDDESEAQRFIDAERPFPRIAVEVDGHAFHEKTPAQVALRNSRDRALQQDGWLVFHFSWSELVTDGESRVREVLDVALAAYFECRRAEASKWAAENRDAFQKAIDAMKPSE